jgi:hypothetical protein
MPTTAIRTARHTLIGNGVHAEVYHRAGSRYVVQRFRRGSRLTVERVRWEYDYLTHTYATMPGLIPRQWMLRPGPDVSLDQVLLVKEFVPVDPAKNLLQVDGDNLSTSDRTQLAHFVAITRGLLAQAAAGHVPTWGVPRLPDIIDTDCHNLALDTAGRLRLLDTNELISTAHLYDLIGTGAALDLDCRWIHAKFFNRLLLLEHLTGRTSDEQAVDPLYRSFLTTQQISDLAEQATEGRLSP